MYRLTFSTTKPEEKKDITGPLNFSTQTPPEPNMSTIGGGQAYVAPQNSIRVLPTQQKIEPPRPNIPAREDVMSRNEELRAAPISTGQKILNKMPNFIQTGVQQVKEGLFGFEKERSTGEAAYYSQQRAHGVPYFGDIAMGMVPAWGRTPEEQARNIEKDLLKKGVAPERARDIAGYKAYQEDQGMLPTVDREGNKKLNPNLEAMNLTEEERKALQWSDRKWGLAKSLDALAFIPVASIQVKKSAAVQIAKTKDAAKIKQVLLKEIPDLSDDLANVFAKFLTYADDVNSVQDGLNQLEFLYKGTKAGISKITPAVAQATRAAQPFASTAGQKTQAAQRLFTGTPPAVQSSVNKLSQLKNSPGFPQADVQLETLIELSEPGSRLLPNYSAGYGAEVTGISSTFPDWIPENLRSKQLMEKVYGHIENGTIPRANATREIELYNAFVDYLDDQVRAISPSQAPTPASGTQLPSEMESLQQTADAHLRRPPGPRLPTETESLQQMADSQIRTSQQAFQNPGTRSTTEVTRQPLSQTPILLPQTPISGSPKLSELIQGESIYGGFPELKNLTVRVLKSGTRIGQFVQGEDLPSSFIKLSQNDFFTEVNGQLTIKPGKEEELIRTLAEEIHHAKQTLRPHPESLKNQPTLRSPEEVRNLKAEVQGKDLLDYGVLRSGNLSEIEAAYEADKIVSGWKSSHQIPTQPQGPQGLIPNQPASTPEVNPFKTGLEHLKNPSKIAGNPADTKVFPMNTPPPPGKTRYLELTQKNVDDFLKSYRDVGGATGGKSLNIRDAFTSLDNQDPLIDWVKNKDSGLMTKAYYNLRGAIADRYDFIEAFNIELRDITRNVRGKDLKEVVAWKQAFQDGLNPAPLPEHLVPLNKKISGLLDKIYRAANEYGLSVGKPKLGYISEYLPKRAEKAKGLFSHTPKTPKPSSGFRIPRKEDATLAGVREKDIFELLEGYINHVGNEMYLTGPIEQSRSILNALKEEGLVPRGVDMLDKMLDNVVKPKQIDNLTDKIAHLYNKMLAVMSLGGNVRHITTQILSLGHTAARVKPVQFNSLIHPIKNMKPILRGIPAGAFSKKSKMLYEQMPTVRIKLSQPISRTGMGDLDRNLFTQSRPKELWNKTLSYPQNKVEEYTVKFTAQAGFEAGTQAGLAGPGMPDYLLPQYADNLVATTQTEYDAFSRVIAMNPVLMRTAFPFKSSSFDAYKLAKSIAGAPGAGMPIKGKKAKIETLLNLVLAMTALDEVQAKFSGRKKTFLNYYAPIVGDIFTEFFQDSINTILGTNINLGHTNMWGNDSLSIVNQARTVHRAIKDIKDDGDFTRMAREVRKWAMGLSNVYGSQLIEDIIRGVQGDQKSGSKKGSSGISF